jgi:transcriptional regulator with XRE-family HTH domain
LKETSEKELRANIVGSFVKAMRLRAALTQDELARKLSYSSAQFVSNWERGISLPPLDILAKLCVVCRTSPDDLVDVLYSYQEEVLKVQKRELRKALSRATSRIRG